MKNKYSSAGTASIISIILNGIYPQKLQLQTLLQNCTAHYRAVHQN